LTDGSRHKSGVPGARIVVLPGAGHFVFLTGEAEVVRGRRTFLAGLASINEHKHPDIDH
jgi:pimeloyl-ACP methyl ester carboxylesterase